MSFLLLQGRNVNKKGGYSTTWASFKIVKRNFWKTRKTSGWLARRWRKLLSNVRIDRKMHSTRFTGQKNPIGIRRRAVVSSIYIYTYIDKPDCRTDIYIRNINTSRLSILIVEFMDDWLVSSFSRNDYLSFQDRNSLMSLQRLDSTIYWRNFCYSFSLYMSFFFSSL